MGASVLGGQSFHLMTMLNVVSNDTRIPHCRLLLDDFAPFILELPNDTQDLALLVCHAHLAKLTGCFVIATIGRWGRSFRVRCGFAEILFHFAIHVAFVVGVLHS